MIPRVGSASADDRVAVTFSSELSGVLDIAHQRILLFVAPPGSISDALSAAIEREFTWITVRRVPEPRLACVPFDCDVQLVLVDFSLIDAFRRHRGELMEAHPRAMAAVLAAHQEYAHSLLPAIDRQIVCGVLPMDVNLDIWLSIIRIMLKGGEYFPPALFRRQERVDPPVRATTVILGDNPPIQSHREPWSQMMEELTGRELEVLAMVAKGHQNKIIAADLGLSEHTVKIHLHNIISKLGVHNRTEAAAMYFEHAAHREGSDAPSPEPRRGMAGDDAPDK